MRGPTASIDEIINAEVQKVTSKLIPAIQRAISEAADAAAQGRPARGRARGARRRRRAEELTRWVADHGARRVPLFVIAATGLDTKKKIVAKYGEDAVFEKGKPLPPVKAAPGESARSAGSAARVVRAKPPVVRKSA